jgi:hypothetical protein
MNALKQRANLPAKSRFLGVDLRGFEPLTSAVVQRRHDTLLDPSEVCKIAVDKRISALSLFRYFCRFARVAARLLHMHLPAIGRYPTACRNL